MFITQVIGEISLSLNKMTMTLKINPKLSMKINPKLSVKSIYRNVEFLEFDFILKTYKSCYLNVFTFPYFENLVNSKSGRYF